jgi:hypothetical protein
MKLRLPHVPYVANKITIDLFNAPSVRFTHGSDEVKEVANNILEADVNAERALEEKVSSILEENEDEIEFMRVDRKNLFWLAKKKIAAEEGFLLSFDDRYSSVAHKVLDTLKDDDLISYNTSDNLVKNTIFEAIQSYLNSFEKIEDMVIEKISNFKREITPGTEEYDIIFEKLYHEELDKRGLI